jgi:O-succinylbenzoate synthase
MSQTNPVLSKPVPTNPVQARIDPPLVLQRVRLVEIHLPLREPFAISSGVCTTRRIFLLELEHEGGLRCWSECVAGELPNYSPETIDTAWLALREWLVPRVLGRPLASIAEAASAIGHDVRGHLMAQAALEMGLWGLLATREGLALARLIGGTRDRVAVGISLGIQRDPPALVERAAAALRAGYRKIKLKIKPGQDVEYVAAVRAALGKDAPLMADANNAYTLADADHLQRLDEFELVMIEQPLAWDDVVRHAELQRRLRTPICLDESITSVEKAEDMIRLGAGRIINVKPGRVGGFGPSRAIHDVCAAAQVPVWCGGMLESGVGRAYNVALATLPNFKIPGDISPSARYWMRDVVTPEWTMDARGEVAVPDKPGLGVTVDVDRIDDLAVRSEWIAAR